jgi:SAM-dependent methyltransferase
MGRGRSNPGSSAVPKKKEKTHEDIQLSTETSPYPADIFPKLAPLEAGHWWFVSRNALLLWVMKNKVTPFRSFLEIGCGTGFVLQNLQKNFPSVEFYGSEYFEEGLSFARRRVPSAIFRRLDATELDEEEVYDSIGAFDVLEHIEKDGQTLHNLARALTKKGHLVVTVPQHRWLWSDVDRQAHHVRRYNALELKAKMRKAGLQIVFLTSFVSLLVPLMWIVRRKMVHKKYDPLDEFRISGMTNFLLSGVMRLEFFFIRMGIRLPWGGSLLMIARKP